MTKAAIKKPAKKRSKPAPKKKPKVAPKKTTSRATPKKTKPAKKKRPASAKKKPNPPPRQDSDIIIVDDGIQYDPKREAEERRAYLEEARSQDAFD